MTLSRAALLASVLFSIAPTAGCDPSEADTGTKEKAGVSKPESPEDIVGYDLRRLRPNEDETLSSMFERLHKTATRDGKRVVILFSADWCDSCKQLDLELGNTHTRAMIGDVRIFEIKEDDWQPAARMDEFNALRRRWEPILDTYPLVVLLDAEAGRVDEMKAAKDRLEAEGLAPTFPIWLDSSRGRRAAVDE